jgi:hypothetical protein
MNQQSASSQPRLAVGEFRKLTFIHKRTSQKYAEDVEYQAGPQRLSSHCLSRFRFKVDFR